MTEMPALWRLKASQASWRRALCVMSALSQTVQNSLRFRDAYPMMAWLAAGVSVMRVVHLAATALALAVAGCAAHPPAGIVQQRSDASCTTNLGDGEGPAACKRPRRLAGTSPGARAEVSKTPAFEDSMPSAMSSGVPMLDVDQVCQGIAEQGGANFQDPDKSKEKKHCLDDEAAVRKTLGEKWQSFEVGDRTHCTNESKMGGQSSYSELITCLEMRQAVRQTHEQLEAARHGQTIGQR